MKTKHIYFSLTIFAVAFLIFSAFTTENNTNTENPSKVIKFSHQQHAQLMACEDCHSGVTTATNLKTDLLPKMELCSSCHDVEDPDKCSQCHFDDLMVPFTKSEPTLLFDHAWHLKNAPLSSNGEKCLGCHKDINVNTDVAFRGQFSPSMAECWICHGETKSATASCEACHISTVNLKPKSHELASLQHGTSSLLWRPVLIA